MHIIKFKPKFDIQPEYYPVPASKCIPEWYKKIDSYIGGKKTINVTNINATIKKCMPVFDTLTMGYIIPTPVDVHISLDNNVPFYQYPAMNFITMHSKEQATGYPSNKEFDIPKFNNPWAIKTAPGYSCLFVTPFHHNLPFTTLPGFVDTDTYSTQVNFPFVLNNPKFEGIIYAGTPMVQVIPIKREEWKMEINDWDNESIENRLSTKFFNRYKTLFWHSKQYK